MGGFGLGEEFGSEVPQPRHVRKGKVPKIDYLPDLSDLFDFSHEMEDIDRFDFKMSGGPWNGRGAKTSPNWSDFRIGLGQAVNEGMMDALGMKSDYVTPPTISPDRRRGGIIGTLSRGIGSGVAGAGKMVEGATDLDLDEMTGGFGRIMKKLGKFKPNIMMVWNFLALLIPVLVTLAGAAIGAAAALIGLATAGAAIVGLGLLGYGENAAESMDLLKRKLGEVKNELFSSLKPAFKAMNPILDGWLDGLAGAANRLVGPLTRLAGFEGFLGDVGGGILDWIIGFLNVISDLRPEIQAVGSVIGNVFGNMNIMEWGINEIYDNMGAFIQLGSVLMSLIVIIYNLSKAIAFAVSPFAPLFKMVAGLSDLLANKWVSAILSAMAAVLLLYGALVGLNMLFAKLTYTAIAATITSLGALIKAFILLTINMLYTAKAGIATMITGLFGLASAGLAAIGVVGALNAALAATVALIAATGVGALLVLAGGAIGSAVLGKAHASAGDLSGGGGDGFGGYSGGMGGATINIYGDVGNSEYQKLQDEFPAMYAEETETRAEAEK